MHRLISFARNDSAPVRTRSNHRRLTIDGLDPRSYLAGLPLPTCFALPVASSVAATSAAATVVVPAQLATQ